MSTVQPTMSVARLAERAGVTPDTVRYYERIGLLHAAARTAADHRRYGDRAVDRLLFIHGMQRLGLRLADIRVLLELRENGSCPCEPAASLLRHRLGQLDEQIATLVQLRDELARYVERIPAGDPPEPTPGTWQPRKEAQS